MKKKENKKEKLTKSLHDKKVEFNNLHPRKLRTNKVTAKTTKQL